MPFDFKRVFWRRGRDFVCEGSVHIAGDASRRHARAIRHELDAFVRRLPRVVATLTQCPIDADALFVEPRPSAPSASPSSDADGRVAIPPDTASGAPVAGSGAAGAPATAQGGVPTERRE
jgi:hypothetical protein